MVLAQYTVQFLKCPSSVLHLLVGILKEKIFLLFNFYSSVCSSIGFMDLCFIPWVVFCSYHYFDVQIVQVWSVRASSSWILSSFDVSPSFFKPFLTFWRKMFQAQRVLFRPSPGISISPTPLVCFFNGGWYLESKISLAGLA